MRDALDHIAAVNGIDVIIEGCANGPDRWAEEYAAEWGIAIEHYPADWARLGKAAGHMRNAQDVPTAELPRAADEEPHASVLR